MEFEWDEQKRDRVIEKHGVDLVDAALVFEGPVYTRLDRRSDYGEDRYLSIGIAKGKCVVVVHTERDGITRLISAWYGGRKDYELYQKSIARRNSTDG